MDASPLPRIAVTAASDGAGEMARAGLLFSPGGDELPLAAGTGRLGSRPRWPPPQGSHCTEEDEEGDPTDGGEVDHLEEEETVDGSSSGSSGLQTFTIAEPSAAAGAARRTPRHVAALAASSGNSGSAEPEEGPWYSELSVIFGSPHGRALLIESFAFLLVFTAWNGIQNILSSISLGAQADVSFFIMYLVYSVCSLVAPVTADRFPARIVMPICCTMYVLYMAKGIFQGESLVHWVLLCAASVVRGGSGAFLWTAQGRYTSLLAAHFSHEHARPLRATMGTFSGIFLGIFYITHVSGNVLDSVLLSDDALDTRPLYITMVLIAVSGTVLACFLPPQKNLALVSSEDRSDYESGALVSGDEDMVDSAMPADAHEQCEIADDAVDDDGSMSSSSSTMTSASSSYSSSSTSSSVSSTSSLSTSSSPVGHSKSLSAAMVESAWMVLSRPVYDVHMLLMVALFVAIGVSIPTTFDFFPRVIGSVVGKHSIGYVMGVFGACAMFSSVTMGRVADYSLWPVVCIGFVAVNFGCAIVSYAYLFDDIAVSAVGMSVGPAPALLVAHPWLVVLCSASIGIGLGSVLSMNSTLLSTLFTDTLSVAFASFNFWETLSATVSFTLLPLIPVWAIFGIFSATASFGSFACAILIYRRDRMKLTNVTV